ncbi:MAG: LCP family protein [Eubacterium sp.]|nr:LCP family protein [Eubacterium sp.]
MSKNRKKSHRGAIAAIIIIILVLLAIIAMLFVQGKLSKINRTSEVVNDAVAPAEETFEVDEETADTPNTINPETVQWDKVEKVETLVPETAGKVTNILLIGQDARSGEGRQRSDSMVICSLNENTNTITLSSLMRDMYVPIPGYSDNRINAAYAFGGMPLLDQVIEEDFGIKIDGNFEVNLDGFLASMEQIGNLDMYLTAEEAAYMNENPAVGSGTDESSEVWYLTEGWNSLTPSQALAYSRMRHIGNSDYERTERQRNTLTAAFNKIAGSSATELLSVADAVLPCLTTDMSQKDIMALVTMAQGMHLNETSYRIPVDGTFSSESIHGMAVLVPDLQANSDYLKEYLYGTES